MITSRLPARVRRVRGLPTPTAAVCRVTAGSGTNHPPGCENRQSLVNSARAVVRSVPSIPADAINTVVALEIDGPPPPIDPPVIAEKAGAPVVLDYLKVGGRKFVAVE